MSSCNYGRNKFVGEKIRLAKPINRFELNIFSGIGNMAFVFDHSHLFAVNHLSIFNTTYQKDKIEKI
jgi:hypothetical protein